MQVSHPQHYFQSTSDTAEEGVVMSEDTALCITREGLVPGAPDDPHLRHVRDYSEAAAHAHTIFLERADGSWRLRQSRVGVVGIVLADPTEFCDVTYWPAPPPKPPAEEEPAEES